MCGICGMANMESKEPANSAVIASMMRLLEHRGPDEQGTYMQDEVGLGFQRLVIVDLATGQQPLANERGDIWLILNGEIWNYRVLRAELAALGHTLRSQGDAEVVVHIYEEYGVAGLTRLQGMFALAIWDSRQRRLLLARDRVGKKPLYYTLVGGDLLFASEIKALFCDPRVKRQADLQAMADFLSVRYVPGPSTLFADIYKVQAGHWLLYEEGRIHTECYWDFAFAPLEAGQPCATSTYMEGLREHIHRSVEERLMGDVPLGALLSGGIDSSLIVGLMSQISAQPVHTFAVGFDMPGFSELPYACQVAQHFGTIHHELLVTGDELPRFWPLLTWHRDEPVSEPSDLGMYLVSRLARQYVKVVLSGEGGDELFAGYPKYAVDTLARYYHLLPPSWRRNLLNPLLERLPYGMRRLKTAARALTEPAPQRWMNWFGIFHTPLKERLLASSVKAQVDMHAARLFQRWLDEHPQRDNLSSMLYLDTKIWLPDNLLMKTDKMSMAASLEGRFPLLDEQLIAYAASIPSHLKVRGWQTKYILKQAYADFLPAGILRRRKVGFNVPTGAWFRRSQRAFITNLLLSEQMRSRGLFDHACIEDLLREHLDGRANYQAQLFTLVSLELWFRVFIDPPVLTREKWPETKEEVSALPNCSAKARS
ncbi:MAG TPA: asparagine synthase (glutamine-hydrolyzing) [Ktedonobacteraceae bacterium]|nr:asparagine synthase (glutamine-hydrolyzing) [Ktedonobacteraceae bacterium]